jgi:hypothetical protein
VSDALAERSDAVAAARRGIVDIIVTPNAADLRVAARANPYRLYESLLTVLARLGSGAVFAGLTAGFLWLAGSAEDKIMLISTALAGGVVGIAVFRFAIEHQWKGRLARDIVARHDPYRVTGDGRSLAIEDEHVLVRMDLDGLRLVVDAPHHLLVFHRHAPVLALPRTAFPRPEIATALADFLRSRIAPAIGPSPEIHHE